MAWLEKTHDVCISKALEKVHDDRAADSNFDDVSARCLEALLKACSEALSGPEHRVAPFDWTPDVKLEPFGSTQQGTALRISDLDVRLSFEQFAVKDPERMMHYLDAIAEALNAAPSDRLLEVVRVIRGNRLPVLRLKFERSLEVDLTMGEDFTGGAELDLLVNEVLSVSHDEGARRFVRLVKAFSKAQGLVDANGGYLNSLSWVLLAINFLQYEACLPTCRNLKNGRFLSGKRKMHLWPTRPSAGLFVKFFDFVARLGSVPSRISVWNGEFWKAYAFSLSGAPAHPLFIENPMRKEFNVCHCLRDACWQVILERCRKAREELVAAPLGSCTSVLNRIFIGDVQVCEEAGEAPAAKRAKT